MLHQVKRQFNLSSTGKSLDATHSISHAVITSIISTLLALAMCRLSSWSFGFDSGAHLLNLEQDNASPENLLFLDLKSLSALKYSQHKKSKHTGGLSF
jgi:hypothetical protein